MDKCGGIVMPASGKKSTSGKKTNDSLITVTGKFPEMAVGQQWKCEGSWTKHKTFGPQLVATMAEEVRPSSSGDLIAYLCGGATKGVGPVTAGNMVAKYGGNILVVLDSKDAVQKLHEVKGIGLKSAVKIKDEWEKRRGGAYACTLLACQCDLQLAASNMVVLSIRKAAWFMHVCHVTLTGTARHLLPVCHAAKQV